MQTEQLTDRGLKEKNLSLQVADIQHKDYILYQFLPLTLQET